ncbi:hypothetical protein ANCCEY_04088 [Ancylostoma ceylanicum]|uniref:FAD dependent oxidoreductase domain-containing protein n=1 Tax=Ancylostoma ceylanicum TaxID=53326 RepID=A0A0D6M3B7_9BILA|nr:hypothetical protein ANCCEY_04088 [Ancylostoma ceylanicum]
MSGYRFSQDPNIPPWISLLDNVHILSPEEIKRKHPYPQKFLSNGGVIVKQKIESLDSIGTQYDCVVNCTGLGAGKLVKDENLHPIRGQIIRVRCPAVKHFFIDDSSYVLLNDDCVILGGTADKNCWNTAVNPETAQRILHANQENVPALKSCEVISHHVGLRPGRSDVRLELERRLISGKKLSALMSVQGTVMSSLPTQSCPNKHMLQ